MSSDQTQTQTSWMQEICMNNFIQELLLPSLLSGQEKYDNNRNSTNSNNIPLASIYITFQPFCLFDGYEITPLNILFNLLFVHYSLVV